MDEMYVNLSPVQAKRFFRIYTEPFYLLASPSVSTSTSAATFFVSGSKGQPHRVSVNSDGSLTCSCPDAKIHCRRAACVCKHVCFVAICAMRFEDLTFFDSLRLTSDQTRLCVETASGRASVDDDAMRRPPDLPPASSAPSASSAYTRTRSLKFETPSAMQISPECDECPICYDFLLKRDIEEDRKRLRWCPTCSQPVHGPCMYKWLSGTRKATCVMCRSCVWSECDPGSLLA